MNAGRELDALIAEKVMGLKVVKISQDEGIALLNLPGGGHPAGRVAIVSDMVEGLYFDEDGDSCEIPHYSTDIAAAWKVMEKLKWAEPELSWSDEQHVWSLYLNKKPADITPASETAPRAICLAALKALGVELPKDEG